MLPVDQQGFAVTSSVDHYLVKRVLVRPWIISHRIVRLRGEHLPFALVSVSFDSLVQLVELFASFPEVLLASNDRPPRVLVSTLAKSLEGFLDVLRLFPRNVALEVVLDRLVEQFVLDRVLRRFRLEVPWSILDAADILPATTVRTSGTGRPI